MPYKLGSKSLGILSTVEKNLQNVVLTAINSSQQDFSVVFGRRTLEEQYELYSRGRTTEQLKAAKVPGRISAKPAMRKVTWTLNSTHFPSLKTGLGRAVDLAAWVDGATNWDAETAEGLVRYNKIRDAMFAAAKELSVAIRWGGDWNRNGVTERGEYDFGHFELV